MSIRTLATGLVAATVLMTQVFALAQEPRKNLQVFNDAVRAITRYPRFTIFDNIDLDVRDGRVRLTGKVTQPYKRTEIERRVRRVRGVRRVDNDIDVLPVSRGDDRLRAGIARAIYGHPTFWKYAAQPTPPIHIIVERARVTLTGIVNSEVERALARSLASSVTGSLSVDSRLLTDAEVRASSER